MGQTLCRWGHRRCSTYRWLLQPSAISLSCMQAWATSACQAAAQWTMRQLKHLTDLELPLPRHDLSIDATDGDASLQGGSRVEPLKIHFARGQQNRCD